MTDPDPDYTEVHTDVDGNINTSTRSRSWFITINNYTEEDIRKLQSHPCRYIIWQKEKGLKCGTPHIHAYIYYDNAKVWPKKTWNTAYIVRPINNFKCILYCSKELTRIEGPFERGQKPEQGRRSDLEEVAKDVILGTSMQDIAAKYPCQYIRYSKGLQALRQDTLKDRDSENPPKVFWLWGLAGVGKTRIPHMLFYDDQIYIKDGSMWWNGYEQQKCIVIDDFDGKWPYRDFLRLIDRYKYQGQYKGGYVKVNSPFIFITCEHPPWEFWQQNELAQITRRITEIIQVTNIDLIGDTCDHLREDHDVKWDH